MIDVPHAGNGPWRAYSRGQYPNGPFRLQLHNRWIDDVPGARLRTFEQAEATCALLNFAHDVGVGETKAHIRGVLGL